MSLSAAHLYDKNSRLLSQLTELQVSCVAPIGRQQVEPVGLCGAARVVPVSQVQLVHIHLREVQWRLQRDSSQQQFTVAWWPRDDEAQVGGGCVRVGELQVVGGDGHRGAILHVNASVAVEGGGDAVSVLDGEAKGGAARRVPISDAKTVRTKVNVDSVKHNS